MNDAAPLLPIAEAVYLLCAATSIACSWFLYRGFARTRTRLLLWSCLCFLGLAVNNALLFFDRVVFAETDLTFILGFAIWRGLAALAGLMLLLFGLIWDSE